MKNANLIAVGAMLISAPAFAQEQKVSATTAPVAISGTPDRPVAVRPQSRPNGPDWKAINRKINARAKNAIANGARPKVIRKKVKAYKQKLRRRWNASQ